MIKNNILNEVINKANIKADKLLSKYVNIKKYGGCVNLEQIVTMNSILIYLDNIQNSSFEYYYVPKLKEISNYLNKI